MKKTLWITVGVVGLLIWAVIIFWINKDVKVSIVNRDTSASAEQCQYPERALVNGECDNSDPCDPERIKIDGGKCEDDATVVNPTPSQPTQPAPSAPKKSTQCNQ